MTLSAGTSSYQPSGDAPREAVFRHFTVRDDGASKGWRVAVHEHFAYLFAVNGHRSTQPGWMSALRFDTYEEAVAFGRTFAPHVEAAAAAHGVMNSEAHRVIECIEAARRHTWQEST